MPQGRLRRQLEAALKDTARSPSDIAAVTLARVYADAIDVGEGDALKDLGPKFLTVLESLGMTPAARTTLKRGTSGGLVVDSKLAERRERRQRQHYAPDMDTPAPASDT